MSIGLEQNMQMDRKSIRNKKINVMLTLCIWSSRNETNKAWKREEFPFLLPIFVERIETEDDNFFVEMQHQIDPWRSEE